MTTIFKIIGHKARIGTLTGLAGVICLFGLYTKAQTPDYSQIILNGTGYSLPFNNHPITEVKVFSKPDNTFLGSETTDPATGNYSLAFFPVEVQEHKYKKEEMKVLGNPVATSANLELTILDQDAYILQVFDQSGKKLYNQKVHLTTGDNNITISGLGAAGIKILNVTNGTKSFTSKVLQTESTPFAPTISSNAIGASSDDHLKMSLEDLTTDSLFVQFVPPTGYTGMDTTVAPVSQTLNYVVRQVPTIFDFTAYALTINGDTIKPGNTINTVSINVKWGDGTTINYPAVNGLIQIHREEYAPNVSTTIDISNPDTTLVTEYTIGEKRDPLINTKEMNLFQNSKVHSGAPGTPYIPPGPATATLSNLPNLFDIYFVPRLVKAGNGQYYSTRGETFRTVAQGRDALNRKFETTSDTIYWFEMQKDLSYPTNTIPNQQRLEQKQALDSAETLNYLNNGRQIYPNWKRVEIYTQTEPEWIKAQNRDWDQMLNFQYASDEANPSNDTQLIPGGFGNLPRWKNGYANYQFITSLGIKTTEMIQAQTKCRDPPGPTGLTPLAYNDTTGLSEFIETVYHLKSIGGPNVDFW